MRWILIPALAFLAVYIGFALVLFVSQNRLVHLPEMPGREVSRTPAEIGAPWRDVYIDHPDAPTLHGWHVRADDPRGTLLFFHGNAGNISHRLDSIRIFRELGLDVLIFDYRGYGRSEGRPHETGLKEDAERAARWLRAELGVPPGRTVYFGRSLGGALAAHAARAVDPEPAGLILESTFRSLPDLGADLYPFYPVRWLARMDYDTEEALDGVTLPTLVVHSPEDEIVPFAHGRALAERDHARLLEIRGDHNAGFLISGSLYTDGLDGFLQRALPSPGR